MPVALLFLFLFFYLPTGVSAGTAGATQVESLIRQARVAGLDQQPGWLALLHFKREVFSGRQVSQADDDDFFFSPQGKTSPQAELEATLTAMLQAYGPDHAQCLFPARWHWLKLQLGLADRYDVPCPKLEAWLQRVETERLTLVFPVMYLGNPGSSFGHTFLRFDGDGSVMLAQALNYAADKDPADGMLAYVYHGVSGGYTGVFRTRHYFETVQLYSDIEHRDIWEYQLDYSPAEIRQLARHAWEVTDIKFDYFFFRENCSYRLLALLDAAKPEANLSSADDFPLYTIPVDTVRVLQDRKLILKKQYRPSLASQLRTEMQTLSAEETAQVLKLAEAELTVADFIAQAITPEQTTTVLEQAYTLLQFRGQANTEAADAILTARSQWRSDDLSVDQQPLAPLAPPETGHASARLAYGYGRTLGEQDNDSYFDVLWRPAFHDLLDAPPGYVEGSAINMLDLHLRWLPQDDSVQLEKLRFVNIISLAPVSAWYAPLSWQLDAGLQRLPLTAVDSDLAFVARGGGGYSARLADATWFAMALVETNVSDSYQHDYSLLAGAQLGMSVRFAAGQMLVRAESLNAASGFERDSKNLSVEMQFNLEKNLGLRFGWQKQEYELVDRAGWADENGYVRVQQYF